MLNNVNVDMERGVLEQRNTTSVSRLSLNLILLCKTCAVLCFQIMITCNAIAFKIFVI